MQHHAHGSPVDADEPLPDSLQNHAEPLTFTEYRRRAIPITEQLLSRSGRKHYCCRSLTRPVASVMVGELCGTRSPLWLPGMPLARLPICSTLSMLWRGLLKGKFRKP